MAKVFIIVLNFNGREDTLDCLESLTQLRVTGCQLEMVVVDNGSTDGSVKAIRKKIFGSKPPIHFIENEENLGFAGGNNIGIKFALEKKADFVLILNNDTFVDPNLIEELLKVARSDEEVGVLGPKIYFASGFEYHKGRYKPSDFGKVIWYAGGKTDWENILFSHRGVDEVDQGQYDQIEETSFVTGCAMFVKKEVFEKIGFLEEKYFAYLEDADFCERAKKKGFKLLYVPSAFLWHKIGRTTGGIGSKVQDYYITRNRLLFGSCYARFRTKLALFRESLKLLFLSSKRKGVVDFYLGRFGKKR